MADKMATDGGGGVVDGRHSDDCKRDIGPRLKSQPGYNFFSLIFVRIHTNKFIQLIYKLLSTNSYTVWFLYQFIQFLYELYSTNSTRCDFLIFFKVCASSEGEAQAVRGEARAHLLPRPGRTRLPRQLGYTRLPRPVRVRSWGGWVGNGINVYNLYYRLPRLLGYTRRPDFLHPAALIYEFV